MGYDCTLHSVDERQIKAHFVKALLTGVPPKAGGVGDVGVPNDLWSDAFKSLSEDPPELAASAVCQLALIFAAKWHPYHYERGFALALWPDQPNGLGAEVPENLMDSPESMFSGLVKAYPRLRNRFPIAFSGNWSTGVFIPAKKVSKALAWVQKTITRFTEEEREIFRGLVLVLQHCERNKLAYWEGTDLPVPMATISVEGSKARRAEFCVAWPDYGYEPLANRGSLFVCKYRLGPSNNSKTLLADFSTWPPTLSSTREYAIEAMFSTDCGLVTLASDPDKTDYQVRVRPSGSLESIPKTLAVSSDTPVGRNGYEWVGYFENRVVALISFSKGVTCPRYPLIQVGERLVPDHSFRSTVDNHDDHWGGEQIRVAIAKTGAGKEVMLWDNGGFEWLKTRFVKTFALAAGRAYSWQRPTAPAGENGFFYLANACLYEAQRGLPPLHHLPKLTNIMSVRQGPDGSVLVHEGDNRASDWGKLYWPATKEVIQLRPDLLPDLARKDLRTVVWVEECSKFLFFTATEVWFLPQHQIVTLPKLKV